MNLDHELDQFWESFEEAESARDRLELLVSAAACVLEVTSPEVRSKRRKSFYRSRDSRRARMQDPDKCPVCIVCWRMPNQWHHVIQLQHGGDNRRRNIVAMCEKCHESIHPWMNGKRRKKEIPAALYRALPAARPTHKPVAVDSVSRDMRPRLRTKEAGA